MEVWGASGNNNNTYGREGLGGYTYGIISLNNTTLYICCGGLDGYNGGGNGNPWGVSGGGCTHISEQTGGLLSDFSNKRSSILVVAGGGGGVDGYNSNIQGGDGGGGNNNGSDGSSFTYWGTYFSHGGTGGKSDAGGENFLYGTIVSNLEADFGFGGSVSNSTHDGGDFGAGGGGGWYGGGGDAEYGTGGGGSGHINTSLLSGFGGSNGINQGNGYSIITQSSF